MKGNAYLQLFNNNGPCFKMNFVDNWHQELAIIIFPKVIWPLEICCNHDPINCCYNVI